MKNEKDYCNNSRDCECVFWNYGKVCDYCYETNCLALVKYKPPTNYERIKQMSVEEMARENVYFVPNNKDIHYTGLSGKYRKTSKDVIADNIEWLESEVEE